MNIVFLSFSQTRGGAAKAAQRFYRLLNGQSVSKSWISIEDGSIGFLKMNKWERIQHLFVWYLSHFFAKLIFPFEKTKVSLNLFGSFYVRKCLKSLKTEIVHVHWINNETASLADILKIGNPLLITLHDEWLYNGFLHNNYEGSNDSYLQTIFKKWILKRRKFLIKKSRCIFTVPSMWMMDRAISSKIFSGRKIRILPNPISIDLFYKRHAIASGGVYRVLCGAVGGASAYIKGFDLLLSALKIVSAQWDNVRLEVVLFGGQEVKVSQAHGFTISEVGKIVDEQEMANLYSSVNLTIVPSRSESFGQVAAESLACETPVLCFATSGLMDIVQHLRSGYLAEPFEPLSLAEGLIYMYSLSQFEREKMGKVGREHIVSNFSNDVVGQKLKAIYAELE